MNVWQLPPFHHLSRRGPYFAIEPNDKAIYVESSKDIICLEAETLMMADSGSFLQKTTKQKSRFYLIGALGQEASTTYESVDGGAFKSCSKALPHR